MKIYLVISGWVMKTVWQYTIPMEIFLQKSNLFQGKVHRPPTMLHNVNYIGEVDANKIILAGSQILILKDPWKYLKPTRQSSIPAQAYTATEFSDESIK